LAILAGKSITALDRLNRPLHQYRADARQLERWGLSAKNLPPDTLVSFRQPTVWDEHRYLVIATALVLILQTGLVAALLVHRRRRRLAELELKESEERLVSTAASANVGLWQFDRETNEFWVTEHSRALFCLPDDAPLTRASLMSAVHPEDRAIAMSPLQAPADADQPAISDVRVLSPDGKARWIRIRTRSRPETRGSSRRLLGIFVDITEQKVAEAEAARQRQEIAHLTRVRDREGRVVTLNAMSASIAHEMSQPIGAMMASADAALLWLAKTPPDLRNVRASVERIASDGRRASDVIASMRSLLRRTGARLESIDVNDLIRDALAIEQGELQRQRILIKQALAQTVARVTCDRIQLQQVVVNLITNAIEAIGSVTDRPRILQVTSELDGAGDVGIAIEDSGPGIDRKIIDQLFEPFFTTKPHGMGLGLWICRQIVEGHGGRLTASSDLGRGSVFRIILPKGDRRRDATSDAQVG
jgi:PAS domain S-box-containing protein